MKKGCFLTVIISLTILLIGIFYLVRYHGEELIEFGKEQLIQITQNNIISKIEDLEKNEFTDSLNIVVKQYFKDIKKLDIKKELERIEEFSDNIEVIFMDSRIDSAEFDFITNILMKHEQRKEN